MASQTFRDVWGKVALRVPLAPASLVQDWVQDAYDKLIGKRHWAWTRRETVLTTLAARTLTVTFTQGATAITSAALFVASDIGRQIRVAQGPIYTIATRADASNATLTQVYAETGGAQTAQIQDIYLVMPENFRSIHDVTDLTIQRPIAWWISTDRLDLFDPGRVSSDSRFRVLAAAHVSQVPSLLGRITYEAWPFPTAVGSYILRYFIRTDTLVDDDVFQGVLATQTRALVQGALAQAAQWPGTATQRNPYFQIALAQTLREEFEVACKSLDVMDDDQYLMDLQQIDLAKFGLAAVSADTSLLRMTDAGSGDYYGGGFGGYGGP